MAAIAHQLDVSERLIDEMGGMGGADRRGGWLITAGGGLREADLARQVGVPPWKLKSMRAQARGWDQGGLATALKAVAVADAEVKGAADDADFALERAILTVARARMNS